MRLSHGSEVYDHRRHFAETARLQPVEDGLIGGQGRNFDTSQESFSFKDPARIVLRLSACRDKAANHDPGDRHLEKFAPGHVRCHATAPSVGDRLAVVVKNGTGEACTATAPGIWANSGGVPTAMVISGASPRSMVNTATREAWTGAMVAADRSALVSVSVLQNAAQLAADAISTNAATASAPARSATYSRERIVAGSRTRSGLS
ncbi:MAG: hypothetical protein QOH92_558 [Chloroflexota bacterium]|nr:hypothetical protein [Chloroflexota bacterium]